MSLTLDDLMPSQRRHLAKLLGLFPLDEAIGCELAELADSEIIAAQVMFPLGLVEVVDGWRSTHWLMLTSYAQRMLEDGLTE